MKAVEFIKKFGWEYTVNYADYAVNINDLKQYIDAYELVQSCGSLANAKNRCYPAKFIDLNNYYALKQAIALVEEVEA